MGIREYFKREMNEDFLDWWKYEKMSDKIVQSREIQKQAKSGTVSSKLIHKVAKDVLRSTDYQLFKKDFEEIKPFLALGLGIEQNKIK